MHIPSPLRLASIAAALALCLNAQAGSSTSSASSAGSASSGSVSDSLSGSSNSSTGGNKTADGAYHIIDIAQTPGRAGMARVTMQGDEPQMRIVLDLPQTTFDQQRLDKGDMVYAQNRVYGIEFARNDTRKAFYLVLADEWYGELAARPLGT
ncbi:hypothetical protein [Pseudoduganella namucuonensis]|uniref:Uncharacterized protein n=1 Tax=Pseudoduganella namucuonensis TaxID=1035707 RepID=A0A1I7LPR4_9BURK|nr:hypothetical protein [Pseudoduganella namucuonensis]SFV11677.1 hypothetical protein SAMN05216552_103473 [Pseudoduganella namucuonensis]